MRKIGILTFHSCYNYGAVLQAQGLCKILCELGYHAEIIDFCTQQYRRPQWWKIPLVRSWSKGIFKRKFLVWKYYDRQKNAFDSYIQNHLVLSRKFVSEESLEQAINEYDALITGSDQVWNLSLLRIFRYCIPPFFLHFKEQYKGIRISYAACAGHCTHDNDRDFPDLKESLLAINAMSVRNQTTYDYVKDLVGLEPEIVCDPTLLYDFSDSEEEYPLPEKHYIFAYFIGDPDSAGFRNFLKRVRGNYPNHKIVTVGSVINGMAMLEWADICIRDASPGNWIWLLKKSYAVLTDSFHGTIFSIKYQKKCINYFADPKKAIRFQELVKRYHLEKLGGQETNHLQVQHNYADSIDTIKEHRERSIAFLRRALKDI